MPVGNDIWLFDIAFTLGLICNVGKDDDGLKLVANIFWLFDIAFILGVVCEM